MSGGLEQPDWAAILDRAPGGVAVLAMPQLRWVYANAAGQQVTGPFATLQGRTFGETHPAGLLRLQPLLSKAWETGEPVPTHHRTVGGDLIDLQVQRVGEHLVLHFSELTTLQRRSRLQDAVAAVGLEALSSHCPREVDARTAECIRAALDVDFAWAGAQAAVRPGCAPLAPPPLAVEAPLVFGDEAGALPEPLRAAGFASAAAVPGGVGAAQRTAGAFLHDDLAFLQGVAHALAAHRERIAAERARAEVESLWRDTLDGLAGFVIVMNRAGIIEYVNAAALRAQNVDASSVVGTSWETRAAFSFPSARAQHRRAFEAALRGETTHGDFELAFRGRPVVCDVRVVPLHDAQGNVVRVLTSGIDVTERAHAERALRRSEELFRAITEQSPELITMVDASWRITFASRSAQTLLGCEPGVLVGRGLAELIPPDELERLETALSAATGASTVNIEHRMRHHGGRWVTVETSGTNLLDHPAVSAVVCRTRDVSDRQRAQELLQQSHKLEAVGQLAGGLAHDFNNLLTAIRGYAEIALSNVNAGDPLREDLQQIHQAAERAATVTHQLLAFSRRQVLRPRTLSLSSVAQGMEKVLRRVLRENVQLAVEATPGTHAVRADYGQLEQVLLNFAVNARDAMPAGGVFRLRIDDVTLDAADAARRGLAPGPHVRLLAEDTGHGMTPAVLARAFEPFFTTKPAGQGSGLGLAAVYGIVRQTGGAIAVSSEPGQGTRFEILLPRVEVAPEAVSELPPNPAVPRGGETLLLVEDEEQVRRVARRILARQGYLVIEARDGAEALQVETPFDLVVTDVVMPRMGGRELAEALRARGVTVPVLFMSGYSADAALRAQLPEGSGFIEKPFGAETLPRLVRELLDAASTGRRRP